MTSALPMRAVTDTGVDREASTARFVDVEIPTPTAHDYDLLVEVKAVSVNPADLRTYSQPHRGNKPRILGFDAAGVVSAIGSKVTRFNVGDHVYYAGNITRPGSNAQYQLVDERIVGHMPAGMDFASAAALPMATITAWESLFDHLRLDNHTTGTILVVGAAGGVGSMAVQLARKMTQLTVIGTASRPTSARWVMELGAHHVIGRNTIAADVLALVPGGVDYIFSAYSRGNADVYAEVLKPHGHIVAIDDAYDFTFSSLVAKSISWHWEMMFTRPIFTPTDDRHHRLLEAAAPMFADGTLQTTRSTVLQPINSKNITAAHTLLERGDTIGKIVIQDW